MSEFDVLMKLEITHQVHKKEKIFTDYIFIEKMLLIYFQKNLNE